MPIRGEAKKQSESGALARQSAHVATTTHAVAALYHTRMRFAIGKFDAEGAILVTTVTAL
jgi:hypothetical protein